MPDLLDFSTAKARQAHRQLCDSGEIPAGLLPAAIVRSWSRCRSTGLGESPDRGRNAFSRQQLDGERERATELCRHALPAVESLAEAVAANGSMVLLANDAGYLLHSRGDSRFLDRAERVALMPGADWSEAMRGTNAIGTAIAERGAAVVHGPQHFLSENHFLTCAATPIMTPSGDIAGVLDVSGDRRRFGRDTLGLVGLVAVLVERSIFRGAFPHALTLELGIHPDGISHPRTGLLAVAADGRILAADRQAARQIGIDVSALRNSSFAECFATPLSAVLDHALADKGPLALATCGGGTLVASVRAGSGMRSRLWSPAPASAPGRHRCGPARPQPGQALARLATGDPRIALVTDKVRRVLGRDIPILISGETGSGKELLARAIHEDGPRRQGPLVAVNCAAIPDGLIESELFGYTDGAFSGARRRGQTGRIQQADGGTLFLDEIGDMPLGLQARLLRVIQDRQVTPLGAASPVRVDIHVICATHRRLRDEVAAGRFREDLYYRLNGLAVSLPPLRERSDLPALIELLLGQLAPDQPLPTFAPAVVELLSGHDWPGNIRQLSNVLRTALVMATGDRIEVEHLPDDFLEEVAARRMAAVPAPRAPASAPLQPPAPDLESVTTELFERALRDHGGNVTAAARQLGVSRNTLYRRLFKGSNG